MDAAYADTHLGMVAQVDQRVIRVVLAAAPAFALVYLAHRGLGLSAHSGSRLLEASVGAQNPAGPNATAARCWMRLGAAIASTGSVSASGSHRWDGTDWPEQW